MTVSAKQQFNAMHQGRAQIIELCRDKRLTRQELAKLIERNEYTVYRYVADLVTLGWLEGENIKSYTKRFWAIRADKYEWPEYINPMTLRKQEIGENCLPFGHIIRLEQRRDGWNSQPLRQGKVSIGSSLNSIYLGE